MNFTEYLISILRLRKTNHEEPCLRIDEFIRLALYDETYGYYQRRAAIGSQDFTTSPEISQLFGEMIGLWLWQQWQQWRERHETKERQERQNYPHPRLRLIEAGPGRGVMMDDMLRILLKLSQSQNPSPPPKLEIMLMEISPLLRRQQQEKLARYQGHCNLTWGRDWRDAHDWLAQHPTWPFYFVANELFDAMPIRQFYREGDESWQELRIGLNSTATGFSWSLAPEAFITKEWREDSEDQGLFLTELARAFQLYGGSGLFIDYGYGQDGRGRNTLQAMAQGRPQDILTSAGGADLSSEVDFTHLADRLSQAGLSCSPLATQREFLLNLGLESRLTQLCEHAEVRGDWAAAQRLRLGAGRLIAPSQMGHLFKVQAFWKIHPSS